MRVLVVGVVFVLLLTGCVRQAPGRESEVSAGPSPSTQELPAANPATVSACEEIDHAWGSRAIPEQNLFHSFGSEAVASANDFGIRTLEIEARVFKPSPGVDAQGSLNVTLATESGNLLWSFQYPSDGNRSNETLRFPPPEPLIVTWAASGDFYWQIRTYTFSCQPALEQPDIFQVKVLNHSGTALLPHNCTDEPRRIKLLDWEYSGAGPSEGREEFILPATAYRLEGERQVNDVLVGNWSGEISAGGEKLLTFDEVGARVYGLSGTMDAGGVFRWFLPPTGPYEYRWNVNGPAQSLMLPLWAFSCTPA